MRYTYPGITMPYYSILRKQNKESLKSAYDEQVRSWRAQFQVTEIEGLRPKLRALAANWLFVVILDFGMTENLLGLPRDGMAGGGG